MSTAATAPAMRTPADARRALNDPWLYLLYLALYLTPLGTIGELAELLRGPGEDFSLSTATTPAALKVIKDLILWTFLLLMIRKSVPRADFLTGTIWVAALCAVTGAAVALSVANGADPRTLASGFRWIFPLFLVGFAVGRIGDADLRIVTRIMGHLFILNFVLQLFQAFLMPSYFGSIGFYHTRNPGFFAIPNTAGLFVVLCAYLQLYFSGQQQSRGSMWMYGLGAFATGSSAGILGIICLYGHYATRRYRALSIVLFPLIVLIFGLLFYQYSTATRGEGSLDETALTRLGLLQTALSRFDIVSSEFGQYTNTAVIMASLERAFVADSLWTALAGNLGMLGIAAAGLFTCLFGVLATISPDRRAFPFFLVFFIASISSTTVEAFPFNFLSALLFAYFLRSNQVPGASRLAPRSAHAGA